MSYSNTEPTIDLTATSPLAFARRARAFAAAARGAQSVRQRPGGSAAAGDQDAGDDHDPADDLAGRIGSDRKIAARTTASAGTRNWYAAVRVGPMTLTPFWTTTFETPAARKPE